MSAKTGPVSASASQAATVISGAMPAGSPMVRASGRADMANGPQRLLRLQRGVLVIDKGLAAQFPDGRLDLGGIFFVEDHVFHHFPGRLWRGHGLLAAKGDQPHAF